MNNPRNKTQLHNGCNCKSPDKCPLPAKCLTKSLVYRATVSTNDSKPDQTYIGLTSNPFKTRFASHKTSFTNVKKKHATEHSNYIWQLKDKNVHFQIKWEFIKQASPYTATPLIDATYVCGNNTSSSATRHQLLWTSETNYSIILQTR